MQRHRCKSLCVCTCAPYCMCVILAVHVCALIVSVCATPQRLSSLSSEATGVQSVCFHTLLLRHNMETFFFSCFLSFAPVCFLIVFLLVFSSSLSLSLKPSPCLLPFPPLTSHPHFFLPSTPAKLEALRS